MANGLLLNGEETVVIYYCHRHPETSRPALVKVVPLRHGVQGIRAPGTLGAAGSLGAVTKGALLPRLALFVHRALLALGGWLVIDGRGIHLHTVFRCGGCVLCCEGASIRHV